MNHLLKVVFIPMKYAAMLLFQPIPVAHLVESVYEKMQARAPSNPVRKVGLFC